MKLLLRSGPVCWAVIGMGFLALVACDKASAQERLEATVWVTQPQPVNARLVGNTVQVDYVRQWRSSDVKLGQKTLTILTSDEPGRFTGVEIQKGLFIESYAILPKKRAPGDTSKGGAAQESYTDNVYIEIDWGKSINPDLGDASEMMAIEVQAVKKVLIDAGFGEGLLPNDPVRMLSTFREGMGMEMVDAPGGKMPKLTIDVVAMIRKLLDAGYPTDDAKAKFLKGRLAAVEQVLKQIQQPNQPRGGRGGPPVNKLVLKDQLEKLYVELVKQGKSLAETYLDHVQKAALMKALGFDDKTCPLSLNRVRLSSVEKLASVLLRMPALKDICFEKPGPGMNDHGANALNVFATRAANNFNYVMGKPGAEEALTPAEQKKADTVFFLTLKAKFTPTEPADKLVLSSASRPFRAGVLGETIKTMEIGGRTDSQRGSLVQWWLIEALHPKDLEFAPAGNSHVFMRIPRNESGREMLIRVRAREGTAGEYSLKCTDKFLKEGQSVRAFLNDQPLLSGFPY